MKAVLCLGEWAGYLGLGIRHEVGVLIDIALGGGGGGAKKKIKDRGVEGVVLAFFFFG